MLDIESVRNDNCGSRKLDLSAYMNKWVKDLVAYLTSFKDENFLIQSTRSLETMYKIEAGNIVETDSKWDKLVIGSCSIVKRQGGLMFISVTAVHWALAVHSVTIDIEIIAHYLVRKGASVESPTNLGSNAAELAIELYRLGFTTIDDPVVQLVGELWTSNFCTYTSLISSATNIVDIIRKDIFSQIAADDKYDVVAIALYIAEKLCTKVVGKGSNSIAHGAVELAVELYKLGCKTKANSVVSIATEMYTGTSASLVVQNAIASNDDIYRVTRSSKIKETLGF